MTTILIAMCDLDSPFLVTIIDTENMTERKSSSSLNGSSFLSLENRRSSRQRNSLQFENSCHVSKNVLDNFCQLDTNEISTFRGCLQLTASPFRSLDCEEIFAWLYSVPQWGHSFGIVLPSTPPFGVSLGTFFLLKENIQIFPLQDYWDMSV